MLRVVFLISLQIRCRCWKIPDISDTHYVLLQMELYFWVCDLEIIQNKGRKFDAHQETRIYSRAKGSLGCFGNCGEPYSLQYKQHLLFKHLFNLFFLLLVAFAVHQGIGGDFALFDAGLIKGVDIEKGAGKSRGGFQ